MKRLLISLFALSTCGGLMGATVPDVDFLGELVSVRSFSRDIPAVNRAQRLMKAWLERRGVACTLEKLSDGHEVLFAATQPGKEQDFVFAAHLDTVPAEDNLYPMRREGDKVFGRGVSDCKGNCVAVAQVLAALNGKASVGCIFGADEEIGGETTRALVERGYRPRKMALVVDGGWNRIIYAQKGHTYFTVTARGKGGHSSRPWTSDDQITRLMLGYAKLRAAWDAKFPLPPDKWTDVLSATYVKGDGGALNRIPDEASFVVNLRSVRPESADEAEKLIREVTGLEVVRGEDSKPCSSDPNHPLVAALRATMRKAYPGEDIPLERMLAATDARCFYDCGVPVMVIGTKGGGAHAPDEWESVSSIGVTADWLIDFVTTAGK
ncbi:MAG: M20/M25/M40 family metallo-hydrolase [Kiritimatiellae bacterium]|nr:M20/M25/M40 family metallo-hydrolase [Kiritimatiellia bacterium]